MTGILGGLIGSFSGEVGDFELIETITLANSLTASVSFSSIPSNYKHLQVRGFVRCALGAAEVNNNLSLTINDATSGYSFHTIGNTTASTALSSTATTGAATIVAARIVGGTNNSNYFSPFIMDFPDAFSSIKNKTFLASSANLVTDARVIHYRSGLYASTSPINKLTFGVTGNFTTNSKISLYGIRG